MPLPFACKPAPVRITTLLALLASSLAATPAAAETSPYYIGLSQSLGHESNLYRIADSQTLSDGLSRSDTISATSLIGGIDQSFGRQRVYGSLDLGINRYANNKSLNNESYGVKLALDWETLERLSGTLRVGADQALTQFNNRTGVNDRIETKKNIVNTELIDAKFRLGRQTALRFEAGLGYRQRSYSAPEYDNAEFHETTGSLGARYRPSAALDVGASLRQASADYPRFRRTGIDTYESDTVTRRYIDLTANWTPNALSQVNLRLSPTRISYDKNAVSDFSGLTGSADWGWQVAGKTKLHTILSRDAGQSADAVNLGIIGPGVVDTSQVTNALLLQADHELTGKISLNASLGFSRRHLTETQSAVLLGPLGSVDGYDNTTTLRLGGVWAITRSAQFGCNVHNEKRNSSNAALTAPFDGYGFSCYGQLVLQ